MRKNFQNILRRAALTTTLCLALSAQALAADTLIPVGEPVGIRLEVAGVLVAGTSAVETEDGVCSPAQEAGVRAGDVITAVDGVSVEHAEELAADIAAAEDGESVTLTLLRGGRELTVNVAPVRETDEEPRLGMWLRDGVTGIGTLTYIDPETGAFGALGHGVNDPESGALLPASGGVICPARVVDVTPGRANDPGELSGSFTLTEELGVIRGNTNCGVFGIADRQAYAGTRAMPVAAPEEVENGPAAILVCVDGQEAREYDVEICRAGLMAGAGRDLTVFVTDPELLAVTGGIVQGMSGSPILQNGKIVGAVTHVLVSDPTRGYGIFAENMLAAAAAA